ncbi:oxidoreductase [Mycobacterium saskatchewanense]|uniref:Monooxygenase n=1 Tax=Mycobacterium saskatchewanense TaxID=220927 RepID=A0AAJ3NS81_9MYCO|nr:NAD(P)/FAD-dependent oxidoreductase [Mycobacterium saskatchewanense]ORW72629.1 monooxygenase [Mycobacterium saskatchewanense]BBX66021.1 oxidoreductase [Mycobacterium saskatchewanense]
MIDLLVVGGGPAGLATAIHGAKAGLDVVVVERRSGPIDKACGEGLMPHTLRHLGALGVHPYGKPIRGISYRDGSRRADARFARGAGRGVRRTVLHRALLDAAAGAGVRICQGEVGEIRQDAASVGAGQWRARYLAAADGLHSPIRRSLGLERPSGGARRWGVRRHVRVEPWSDYVEVHWAPGVEAYVTPVADDCVGVAMLTSRRGGFDRHLDEFAALRDRLGGRPHEPDRAAGPLRQRVSNRACGRVLLVGDAAGYVDALTGEGLGLAFGAAQLAVDCVVADRPDTYDRRWRRMTRRYRMLTAALLQASSHPPTRARIVPAAAALPTVFTGVVNLLAQ